MHDGQTSDLVRAIELHASSGNNLRSNEAQDLLNFLRSL